jgi:hypothetical protein
VLFVSNAPFFCFNQGSVTLSQGNPQAGTHDHRPVFMGPGSRCARPGRRWSDAFWPNEPNCDFGQTKPAYSGRPAKAAITGRWSWIPALALLGRDDDPVVRRTNLRL